MTHIEKIENLKSLVLSECKKMELIPIGHGVSLKIEFFPLEAFAQIEISTQNDSILDVSFKERFEEWIEEKCSKRINRREQHEIRIQKTRVLSTVRHKVSILSEYTSEDRFHTLTIREVASVSSRVFLKSKGTGKKTLDFLNEFLEDLMPRLKLPL